MVTSDKLFSYCLFFFRTVVEHKYEKHKMEPLKSFVSQLCVFIPRYDFISYSDRYLIEDTYIKNAAKTVVGFLISS